MYSISSFGFISVVVPDLKLFLYILASVADANAVKPDGIKTLLANSLIEFFVNDNPAFSNGPRSIQRNPPDCIILDNSTIIRITNHI